MQTAAEHTPGPWRFDQDWSRIPTIFGADGNKVASVEKTYIARSTDGAGYALAVPEREANARLIAAAPEMYEALKLIEQMMSESTSDFRRRSKAEGGGTRQGLAIVAVRAALSKVGA